MNGQVVRLRHIHRHEPHTGFHEGRDERDVTGQSIQLGDQQDATRAPGALQGRPELGTCPLPSARLHLSELVHQLQALRSGMGHHSGALGLQPEARLSLLGGGHAVVGDGGEGHPYMLQGSSERSRDVTIEIL